MKLNYIVTSILWLSQKVTGSETLPTVGSKVKQLDREGSLTRKRHKLLTTAFVNAEVEEKTDPITGESDASTLTEDEEEEMFLRFLQSATSTSYSIAPSASPSKNPSAPPVSSPTKAPTKAPTKSPISGPTKSPTKAPVKAPNSNPTKAPTKAPVTAPSPSPPTTKGPTKAPTQYPTRTPSTVVCKDSGNKFILNGNKRGCRWVRRNEDKISRRCRYKNVDSHCPNTCGACATYACSDSKRKWYLWGNNDKERSCTWVGRKPDKRANRCKKAGVKATCRGTCQYCN